MEGLPAVLDKSREDNHPLKDQHHYDQAFDVYPKFRNDHLNLLAGEELLGSLDISTVFDAKYARGYDEAALRRRMADGGGPLVLTKHVLVRYTLLFLPWDRRLVLYLHESWILLQMSKSTMKRNR